MTQARPRLPWGLLVSYWGLVGVLIGIYFFGDLPSETLPPIAGSLIALGIMSLPLMALIWKNYQEAISGDKPE